MDFLTRLAQVIIFAGPFLVIKSVHTVKQPNYAFWLRPSFSRLAGTIQSDKCIRANQLIKQTNQWN